MWFWLQSISDSFISRTQNNAFHHCCPAVSPVVPISFAGFMDTYNYLQLHKILLKYHATGENNSFKFGHSLFCCGDRRVTIPPVLLCLLIAINSKQLWIIQHWRTVHSLGYWILTIRFLLPEISSSETERWDQQKTAGRCYGVVSSSPFWGLPGEVDQGTFPRGRSFASIVL